MRSRIALLVVGLLAVAVAAAAAAARSCEPCPLCPPAYRHATPDDDCRCKYRCDVGDCGGFVGQSCGDGRLCLRDVGNEMGYCGFFNETGILVAAGQEPPVDCLLCPQGSDVCSPGFNFAVIDRSCDSCGRITCLEKDPALSLQKNDTSFTNCAKCDNVVPSCRSNCTDCVMIPQSCMLCGSSVCLDDAKDECYACPAMVATCVDGCAEGLECVTTNRTCTSCGSASCQPIPGFVHANGTAADNNGTVVVADPRNGTEGGDDELECIVCITMMPECPVCAFGETCLVSNSSCKECPKAACTPLSLIDVMNTPMKENGLSPLAIAGIVVACAAVSVATAVFVLVRARRSREYGQNPAGRISASLMMGMAEASRPKEAEYRRIDSGEDNISI